jgi:hypothetical protein
MPSNKETDSKPKPTSPYSKEERTQMQAQVNRSLPMFAAAVVVLASVTYGLLNNKIDFSQYQSTTAKNLTDIGPRIKYVLQHSTLGVTWLLFCMFYVISRRIGSPAMDPVAGYEKRTEAAKNIFTNSLEQFVMSVMSQLILVTHLEPDCILNIIPILNLLFIFGRVMFWLGYPKYRAFGFAVTIFPTIATIGFNTYKFTKIYF